MNSSPIRFIAAAALTAAMALPLAASAQQAPPAPPAANPAHANPGQRHHRGGHYLHALHHLNLSDAQRQQIRTAMTQMRQANQNVDPQTRRANIKQLRSQIDGILTPDQRARLHNELRRQHRNIGAPPAAPPAPQG
jgi:Spy/CpxP family protein refolding chaperone